MTTQPLNEAPVFARLYDFTTWLIPCVEKFPRAQRFLLGSRLLDSAFLCHSQLIRARKVTGPARAETLLQADVTLDTLRLQLRLAHELRCLNTKQYEQGANLLNQVGKLLGAWRKG